MRCYFYILLVCLLAGSVSAQPWKDSLVKAKEYYDAHEYNKSYQTFLEAQKTAPGSKQFAQDIGTAAYQSGKYKAAEEAFKLAIKSDPTNKMKSKHWHNVGNSQMKQKNYSEAIESYKNALREDPANQNARYNLAVAKQRLKQKQQQKKNNQNSQQKKQKDNSNKNNQNQKGSGKNSPQDQQQKTQQHNNPNETPKNGDQSSGTHQGKLSNNKSKQLLKDLLNQEMKTKKKVRSVKSQKDANQLSGKQW